LTDIHETLSIEKTEATNFFPGQVAFHYPTYFFRIKELVAWVKKMAIGGHLTNHHLILESDDEWSEIEKTLNENKLRIVSKFAKLGELLVDEKIKESLIEEVPLALLLKLSHQSELLKRIGVFLKDINFYE